ncbi:MAG: hypothetical protein R2941_08680 [Desulfobacterales bacterium]
MKESAEHNTPEYLKEKSRDRIRAGRDSRIVMWQETLEAMLMQIREYLIPGEIIAVESMNPDETATFSRLRTTLDLAPFVTAAFLPPAVANRLKPAGEAGTFDRAAENSCKILVSRVNDCDRILTAEISASNPGIDILDDGILLGCYNYSTSGECISDLSKIIWIHLKQQGSWTQEDYVHYTESWFFRSAAGRTAGLPVNVNHSYIHHPVLIGLSPVKAVFRLMKATLIRLCKDTDNVIQLANDANMYKNNTVEITGEGLARGDAQQENSLRIYVDEKLLGLLKLLKEYDIINFKGFSEAEQREFKITFARVVEEIWEMLLAQAKTDTEKGEAESGQ